MGVPDVCAAATVGRMASRNTFLPDDLIGYTTAHTTAPDDLVRSLAERTRAETGGAAGMQVAPEQATLLALFTRLTGARRAIEVGTFTGLSSLSVARAMPADGRILCLDVSAEFTAIAQEFWAKAGVQDKVELRLGPALETLATLPQEPTYDVAFIDADKVNYAGYWDAIVPRMLPGGLILVDNVLWAGRVLEPVTDTTDVDTAALVAFNEHVIADERVDSVMLAFADGLTMARKR